MKKLLASLSLRQRISIAAAALLAGAAMYFLIHRQREADFKPLFTGVAAEDAAGIVQKLKEAGVEYRLPEGGGSVLVPSAKLAELRLSMAAAGLPRSGRIGFELFDKTNLGATEFTEHINYRRALEGELERSVVSLAEVEQARVHLTFPKDSVFLESQQPAKASVMVKLKPGAKLKAQNVQAINHLMASAVEGLSPDAVSVLDMNGNLLGRPKPKGSLDGPEPSEAVLDYRRRIETDLLAKVNATLEPVLGPNRFRAGVSVECDYSGGEQSEEIFDPARSVMVTSQRSEDTSASSALSSGIPGTPSSLPRPVSRPASGSKGLSRMTENVTYQTSRTVKKIRLPAGNVRKMSLAVLVDHQLSWERQKDGYKRVLTPPSPETLKAIRDLAAGVTGFTPERGDQIVIEALPFETTLLLEPPALPAEPVSNPVSRGNPFARVQWDRRMMLKWGGAAAGILLLAAIAMWLWRRKKKVRAQASVPAELAANRNADGTPGIEGVEVQNQIESKLAERDALQQRMDAQALHALKLSPVITKTSEVLAKHLREKIAKDPVAGAQILRTWIREEEADA